jgi:polyphosphate kinase
MTSMHGTPESALPSEEVKPQETHESFSAAVPEESPATLATLDQTARTPEEGKMRAQAKAESRKLESKPKGKKGSAKVLAGILPIAEHAGEPARASLPDGRAALAKAARKQEKKMLKAQQKLEKKQLKKKLKKKKDSAKELAGSFPMIELIDEQVRTSIPDDLVAKVRGAKSKKHIISSTYPYPKQMKDSDYLEEIELLHIELVKMQAWVQKVGERIVLLFEGRDAAGKGGTIQRFTENLNPRGAKVVALAKPSDTERGQWYFQRYIEKLPTKGEIVFFDRSWYNRGGVEHVMGFCTPHEYLEFMRQTPEFERMMVRSGIRLFKFWFSVSREEQLRRFLGRAKDPLKQWKLSPMDVESLGRWDSYTKAKEAMLFYTDTADAPWTIVRSDDKKRARLNAIKYVLHTIPYAGKDTDVVTAPDPHIVGSAKAIYEHGEHPHTHNPLDQSKAAEEHPKAKAASAGH